MNRTKRGGRVSAWVANSRRGCRPPRPGGGVDATKIDRGQAFASCRDGSLAVVSETSPGKFAIVETVKTPEGARTMGIDAASHRIYLPTTELEPPAPGTKGRPRIKSGSFMIVVVGPTIQIAVFRTYYTEINARQQLDAMALGADDVVYMNAGECEVTDKIMQSVAGRPWDLWKRRVLREMRRAEAEDRA